MNKKMTAKNKPVDRTTVGLKNALFDELDGLRTGKVSPSRAQAFSKSVAQIVNITRLEIEAHKVFSTPGSNKNSRSILLT